MLASQLLPIWSKLMSENCPICKTSLSSQSKGDWYDCPRCGYFSLPYEVKRYLPSLFKNGRDDTENIALISHAIHRMRGNDKHPILKYNLIESILKRSLPSVEEQVNNFILWIGDKTDSGEVVEVFGLTHQSVIGAKSPDGFMFILEYLLDRGLLQPEAQNMIVASHEVATVRLSFDGWQYYAQLKRGEVNSRMAFMAMAYGNKELANIVEDHFKQAVKETGFELYRLDQKLKAGPIDDQLRVAIRTSRFLISDLTDENAGAYWESGYAEGLGKPVIYTCKKDVFEKYKTHFDTNHHLTIIWDEQNIQKTMTELKATIRATLPDEAKLTDD
jgi:predicted small metal-binding protein